MPRIQHKRGTSANLASVNPTPLAGELVWDSTENAIKIGDGATAWSSLAYVTATPRTHTHSADAITSGTVAYARLPVGSTTSTVCAGDDARLSDARTPTAHKASHATGGSDALTPGDIGAAPAASPTFTGVITVSATSGSAGSYAPSVTFSGDSNTGFGQVSGQSDTASVFTAGQERVRVDAAGTIRSYPGGSFSKTYNSFVGDGLYLSSLNTLEGIGTFGAAISWSRHGNSSVRSAAIASIQTGADSDLVGLAFFVHASSSASADIEEAMRIDHVKRVGINNGSPASALDVNGVITVSATSGSAGSYAPSVTFSGDSNTGFGQVSGQSDTASVFTAGHERVRVKSGGAVRFVPLSADPASGEAGDVYYNSSTNKLRVYNGTSWIDLH